MIDIELYNETGYEPKGVYLSVLKMVLDKEFDLGDVSISLAFIKIQRCKS